MAYFDFDFRDVDKQKLCDVLPSLLVQLSARSNATPVVTNSPTSILHMIVGYGDLPIAQW